MTRILFSEPYRAGLEESYLREALASTTWQGDGTFTARAAEWLRTYTGSPYALLTTSCTHALELAAILLELGPGDEVILPSFTFSSTATAVAIRGATPVFVDVTPDTLNIDPELVKKAVTEKTKAVFVVHYAGVAARMPELQAIADEYGLRIVEDNAHSLGAYLGDQHLGTFGSFGTQSWHATKNVACGEGGALLIRDEELFERAEIIREKGTNRSRFLRGQVDKYTWVDQGSSYLPSDILAALLVAQFEKFEFIQQRRHHIWQRYSQELAQWQEDSRVGKMTVPEGCRHPAHMFYMMMPSHEDQSGLLTHLRDQGIVGTFHYQPLHSAPAGRALGRAPFDCPVTDTAAYQLVRLPLHANMTDDDITTVVRAVQKYQVKA